MYGYYIWKISFYLAMFLLFIAFSSSKEKRLSNKIYLKFIFLNFFKEYYNAYKEYKVLKVF